MTSLFFIFCQIIAKKWRKNTSWKVTDESSVNYLQIRKWTRWIRPRYYILYFTRPCTVFLHFGSLKKLLWFLQEIKYYLVMGWAWECQGSPSKPEPRLKNMLLMIYKQQNKTRKKGFNYERFCTWSSSSREPRLLDPSLDITIGR